MVGRAHHVSRVQLLRGEKSVAGSVPATVLEGGRRIRKNKEVDQK